MKKKVVKKEMRGGARPGAGVKIQGSEKVKTYTVGLQPAHAGLLRSKYRTLTLAIRSLL